MHTKLGDDYIIKQSLHGYLFIAKELSINGHSTSLVAWQPYQNTVGTWIVSSLSATGSSGTSAACPMTPFQPLSSSGGGGIPMQGRALRLQSTPVGR
jgi:hypothetical protein